MSLPLNWAYYKMFSFSSQIIRCVIHFYLNLIHQDFDYDKVKQQLDVNKSAYRMNAFQLVFMLIYRVKHPKLLTVRQTVHEYVGEP